MHFSSSSVSTMKACWATQLSYPGLPAQHFKACPLHFVSACPIHFILDCLHYSTSSRLVLFTLFAACLHKHTAAIHQSAKIFPDPPHQLFWSLTHKYYFGHTHTAIISAMPIPIISAQRPHYFSAYNTTTCFACGINTFFPAASTTDQQQQCKTITAT